MRSAVPPGGSELLAQLTAETGVATKLLSLVASEKLLEIRDRMGNDPISYQFSGT